MLSCSECLSLFEDIESLIIHIKYCHSFIIKQNMLTCMQKNCKQNFSNIQTFKKHLNLHQKDSSESTFPILSSDINFKSDDQNNERFSHSSQFIRTDELFEPILVNKSNKLMNSDVDLSKQLKHFKSIFSSSCTLFLSEIASNSSVQMKMIKTIIENLKKYVVGVCRLN